MYETLMGLATAIAIIFLALSILGLAILAKLLYMYIFYTVDDDIIKPKDYLIDDFYETNIGDKR